MTDRPNIVLITSDQQLYDTLGFKNSRIKTPALDRLAREGTDFTRAYTNNPVCTPSRATVITGLYPSWHGAWTIGVKLPEDVPTVGQTFIDNGYDTCLVGKAHFQPLAHTPLPGGESVECQPTLRDLDFWRTFNDNYAPWYGFNHVETCRNHADEYHVGGHYGIWMEEQGFTEWRDYYHHYPIVPGEDEKYNKDGHWTLPEEYHYTTWTGERTCANIERMAGEGNPFFIWSSFHDPHPPYLVPEPWASMYNPDDMVLGELTPGELDKMPPPHQMTQDPDADWSQFKEPKGNEAHGYHYHGKHTDDQMRKNMAIYYGMVSFMDHQIGCILDKLDKLGIADNTIIVFSTDHGHYMGHHGLTAKGAFHYEEAIKLPFVARWPGHIPAGRSCDALQALIDLPSTFLSAAGIEPPGLMQGVNQLPVWCGEEESARDNVLVEFRHQPTKVHIRTFINERYKMTLYRDRDWGELFDLQEDPGEVNNLFNDPEVARIKADLMAHWLNSEIAREPMRMPRICNA